MSTDRSFYERLLHLPLFQGIGRGEFLEIAERIRFGFHKAQSGQTIVRQDELCTSLTFMLRGEVCATRHSDNHAYSLHEWADVPMVIQPEALFGLTTRFTRDYVVSRQAELITVDKSAVRDVLFNYPTFRINYLNLLSLHLHAAERHAWRSLSADLPRRFVRFLLARVVRPAGRKDLEVKLDRLADELLDTRLNTSRMLHDLAARNLLVMKRCHILIPRFEQLLQEV